MTTTTYPWTDVSIDLETLGNKYNAPILSIGAAAFNRSTGKIGPTFYQEIDIDSALKVGTPTGDTIAWWVDQSKDAKRIFAQGEAARAQKMHIASALLNFTTYVRSLGTPCPWGNGSSFDVTILEHAIDRGSVGLSPPWQFWKVRDVRTAVDFAESIAAWKKDSVVRRGVHHNALDDAVYQAELVISAYRALGGKVVEPAVKKAAPVVTKQDDDDDL